MASSRYFIVLGLGSFGAALARRLGQNGCRVLGMDKNRQAVDELKEVLYEAAIGDVAEREALEHVPMKEAQAVFISTGEDIAQSLLATLHAKELGAKRIIVKGVTQEHGKLLKSLGVDRVIFPETEIAESLADRMTWTNVVDFLRIDPEYSFMEIAAPDAFSGKSLQELGIRQKYGVWIVGVKDAMTGKLSMFPDGEFCMAADQMLLVVGKHAELEELRNLA